MAFDFSSALARLGGGFSIKTSLRAIVGSLVLVIVGVSLVIAVGAWRELNAVSTALGANEAANNLLAANNYRALERGLTYMALNADDKVSAELSGEISKNREAGDAAIRSAVEQIKGLSPFPGRDELLGTVQETTAALNAYRTKVDAALATTKDNRQRSVIRKWLGTITRAITASHALRGATLIELQTNDAAIAAHQQLTTAGWAVKEYASQEMAVIAGAIAAGKPLSAIRLELLATYRGRLENAWDRVQMLTRSSSFSSKIRDQVEKVKEQFFGDFGQIREEVYAAALAEEPYPYSAKEWIGHTTQASGSLTRLSDEAVTETNHLAAAAESSSRTSLIGMIIMLVTALGVGGFSLWLVQVRVANSITGISHAMRELAGGNLEADIPGIGRSDEIGEMAESVQVFKDNAHEKQALEKRQREADEARRAEEEAQREAEEKRRLAEEERAKAAREERRAEMLKLAGQFEEKVMKVVEFVGGSSEEMKTSAESMVTIAGDTSRQSSAVAAASEQASANVQTVASATEELTSSVRHITEQVNESTAFARNAVAETEKADTEIKELAAAAQKIGDVVGLINDIAGQTNLLALNATIEASRAGDAGKGFAVVASEVKNLANQTAKATEEITTQIDDMQAATEKTVAAIHDIAKIIDRINETASAIASAVEEQDASTGEIARSVNEASRGTTEVSESISLVNDGATSTGDAAGQVLEAAKELAQNSVVLKEQVEHFLDGVRAA